jgi:hypothetical protein
MTPAAMMAAYSVSGPPSSSRMKRFNSSITSPPGLSLQ